MIGDLTVTRYNFNIHTVDVMRAKQESVDEKLSHDEITGLFCQTSGRGAEDVTTLEDALGKLKEGKLDEGRRMLEKLLGRDPSSAVILYNLGMCYSDMGMLEKSAKALQRCVQLDPENSNAYTALGVTLTRLGRHEDAAEELRIALRIDPKNFYAMRNLGAVYCEMGEIDEGVRYLEDANRLFPNKPEVLYGLALAYERKGLKDEAEATYREVVALGGDDPLSEQAKHALTRIATQALQARGPRMDAVMYCLGALQRFASMGVSSPNRNVPFSAK